MGKSRIAALNCAIALALTACTSAPVVPDAPKPARVDCAQPETQPVPAWPVLWWMDGPVFAIQVLGILEQERTYRASEQGCISKLKQEGVIR